MKFTSDYITAVNDKINAVDPLFLKNYSVDIDPSIKMPPVMVGGKAIDEAKQIGSMPWETKVLIMRHSILGQKVTISYKGKPIGPGFVMNSMTDPLDSFPELTSIPALQFLVDVCMSALMEKSLPPQEGDPLAAAGMQGSKR